VHERLELLSVARLLPPASLLFAHAQRVSNCRGHFTLKHYLGEQVLGDAYIGGAHLVPRQPNVEQQRASEMMLHLAVVLSVHDCVHVRRAHRIQAPIGCVGVQTVVHFGDPLVALLLEQLLLEHAKRATFDLVQSVSSHARLAPAARDAVYLLPPLRRPILVPLLHIDNELVLELTLLLRQQDPPLLL